MPTEITEPLTGQWIGNQQWGHRIVTPIGAENVETPILAIDRTPGPPRPLSVHLFRSDRAMQRTGNADVRARIQYGAGGVTNDLLCDYLSGGQFSIVAGALRVSVVTYRPSTLQPYAPHPGSMVLGAMVGLGACASPLPVTFTTQSMRITQPGGTLATPVPDMARTVSLMPLSEQAYNPDNSFMFLTGQVVLAHYSGAMLSPGQSLPIPGGVNQVTVRAGASVPLDYILVFQLGL